MVPGCDPVEPRPFTLSVETPSGVNLGLEAPGHLRPRLETMRHWTTSFQLLDRSQQYGSVRPWCKGDGAFCGKFRQLTPGGPPRPPFARPPPASQHHAVPVGRIGDEPKGRGPPTKPQLTPTR